MYKNINENFIAAFGRSAQFTAAAPGRTELGGNHTDHQNGCVLAAAVSMEIRAAAAENGLERIRMVSEGFGDFEIELNELSPKAAERGSSAAIVRGMAALIKEKGAQLRGVDAYISSALPVGAGLSSSAAFEVLTGAIIAHVSGFELSAVELALLAQKAEQLYFGKPCGLMDQAACALGGAVFLDFLVEGRPIIRPLPFSLTLPGYSLCIIESGSSHTDKTADYASISAHMERTAAYFGKTRLRHVSEADFFEKLPELTAAVGETAALRAKHFFEENRRVLMELKALELGDTAAFLTLVRRSGRSSKEQLRNIGSAAAALELAEKLLGERGAARIHGGGFGGSIQAYVPDDMLEFFIEETEKALGKGSCHVPGISPEGVRIMKN